MTTTLIVAEGMKLKHRAIMVLVDKYKDRLETHGTLAFELRKSGGRPVRVAYLNEEQSLFLMCLMRNTSKVLDFKENISKEICRLKIVAAELFANQGISLPPDVNELDLQKLLMSLPKTNTLGAVYALNNNGYVKVGCSQNPKARINCIITQSGLSKDNVKYFIGEKTTFFNEIERAVFKTLKPYRGVGEWFNVDFKKAIETIQNITEITKTKHGGV